MVHWTPARSQFAQGEFRSQRIWDGWLVLLEKRNTHLLYGSGNDRTRIQHGQYAEWIETWQEWCVQGSSYRLPRGRLCRGVRHLCEEAQDAELAAGENASGSPKERGGATKNCPGQEAAFGFEMGEIFCRATAPYGGERGREVHLEPFSGPEGPETLALSKNLVGAVDTAPLAELVLSLSRNPEHAKLRTQFRGGTRLLQVSVTELLAEKIAENVVTKVRKSLEAKIMTTMPSLFTNHCRLGHDDEALR